MTPDQASSTEAAPDAATAGSPLLDVQELRTEIRLRHGAVHAVDNVSFTVGHGETVGLVGESGCGKTMTGSSIMRLLPPGGHITGGKILLEGRDLVSMSTDKLRHVRGGEIGMVFQDPMTSLNPTTQIGKQIAEAVRLHRPVSQEKAIERAVEVLGLVGMPRPAERIAAYPHQLSGGLRQRVMIAMALACEPKLLIADEPTTALDVTIQAQILALLETLKEKLGMAMILITHDMGVIAGRADRVIVMYAGRTVETARTADLFAGPHHPYTEGLLASIPRLDQDRKEALPTIPGLPPDLVEPPAGCRFAPRCRYATEECRQEDPELGGPDATHTYACFHPRNFDEDGASGSRVEVAAAASESNGASSDLAAAPGDVLLELDGLTKRYRVTSAGILRRTVGALQAVTDVSFGVARGETFGVVGESGCGKTTIARMIVGLERPSEGRVVFDGTDITTLSKGDMRRQRRDLQLMFQDPYASLDPRMRVGTIIKEPLSVQGVGDRRSQNERVKELLDQVGLPAASVDRYPHEFSGGQRQRISLARALALNPRLIVADEPVSALDVSIRSQVLNLIKKLQGMHDLTYIVISHDLSVVRFLADRIAVMYLGKLMELGTADDIYLRAAHPYTAGLLEAVPLPDPEAERAKRAKAVMRGELPSPIDPPSGCRFRTRCPLAQERCAEETPPLRSFGGQHVAACHFPLQEPAAVEPAAV
ncbi:MAG TPA: ABC transporter ATP-binding protein [Solirubrobacteraceae bacterium]|nr:ABC transporter ATP-binding protein [Solirubrobacteraceae bacterium]